MITKILAVLVMTVAMLVSFPIGNAQADEAVEDGFVCEVFHQCGDVRHYNPDHGYDAAFKVTCDWNDKLPVQYLTEGEASTCHDVDGLYVGPGKEVTCKPQATTDGWYKYDSTGWKKITDGMDLDCVHGLD